MILLVTEKSSIVFLNQLEQDANKKEAPKEEEEKNRHN